MQEGTLSTSEKKELIIRKANILDISAIIPILHAWTMESPYAEFGRVTPSTGVWVAQMIKNQLFLVAEYDEKIIGTAGVREHTYPWDDTTTILNVDFIMVLQGYRETGAGLKLIEALKDISKAANMPISMGINHGIDVEKKDRFMHMCGFVFTGGNYLYGVK